MSNLILSLPRYHRHIGVYVAQIVLTILNHVCHLRDLHFTLLNVLVSQQFDKHLYLTSYLNVHNHKTCIHLPQNRLYCAKDGISHYLSRLPRQKATAVPIFT